MPDPFANTGFDPTFGDPLRKFLAAAQAQGIGAHIISGVRDDEDQRQLQANHIATVNGQPLPYRARGPVPAAAAPGQSAHEYGLAADVQADSPADQARLIRLGTSMGLAHPMSYDPTHFEAPGWRSVAANQPPSTPWSETNPANVPSAYAMNMEADAPAAQPGRPVSATPIPGGNDHVAFIQNYAKQIGLDPNLALGIANAEGLRAWSAKNPNAASTVDVQNGQPFSFGDFQLNIHPGAMGAKALAANIDPRDPTQWQAADRFALDQMKAGGVGPWSGDPVAKAYLASGKVPPLAATPGFTINSSAVGAGGPGQGGGSIVDALTKPGADGKQSPLQQAMGAAGKAMDAYGQQDQQQPQVNTQQQLLSQQAAAPIGMQRQQLISNQAQQLAASLGQRAMAPLTWSSAPPGSTPGAGAGQAAQVDPQAMAAQMMAMGRVPGTTLNSVGGYSYG